MPKFLLTAFVVGLVVYWVLKSARRGSAAPDQQPPAKSSATGEEMVRCAECGVHLPRSEGLFSAGRFYCTQEHLLAHRK